MTSPLATTAASARMGTLILEAGERVDDLLVKLHDALMGARARRHRVAIVCPGGGESRLREGLPEPYRSVPIMAREAWWRSPAIDTPLVAFLPADADYWRPRWDLMPKSGGFVRLWIPPLIPTQPDGAMIYDKATGWVATTDLLRHMFDETSENFGLAAVVEGLARRRLPVGYASTPGAAPRSGPPAPGTTPPPLRRDARVLAIVPHHRCEPWLEQCLRSLTRQTRPPEAIVVVDDASPEPPRDIVARFPTVTLLRARENGGPYRLVQTLIDGTGFDAYLLQDADDWSTDDRLALQLAEAERTGAELVGTQELQVDRPPGGATAVCYPLDASDSFRRLHDCQVLHPSSLVSRDLVQRIGGYSSGCRFGADLEFQLRAHYAARIVNIGSFCYFRRRREGSLWTSPETGEHSAVRYEQDQLFMRRAKENSDRFAAGLPPDLSPLKRTGSVALDYVTGPPLRIDAR
jgi:hypothetical protein